MAFNCFCKVDGIPGESTDQQHQDYFDVLSYSHGVSVDSSGGEAATGGHVEGRPNHDAFVVTKYVDKASPKLMENCSTGKHVPTVVIECWRNIEGNKKYYEYKLTDAVVRSVHPSGGGDG